MAGKQMPDMEIPKEDLGIKIGSKLEAKWTETLNKTEEAIMIDTMNLEISEAIVKIANKRIAEEKAKFK